MEKKRDDPWSTHLPSAHTWSTTALTARFNSRALSSGFVLSLVVTTVASHNICLMLMMTATLHNEPPHTCATLGSSWQVPSPTHKLYICIHPFLHQGLASATATPLLPIFSSFLLLSLGEAPIASLPPGIPASLYPLSVTTMVHRNCKTQVLYSHKFCHSSTLSQVAGFTRVSEKDVWASQAGNYRMTSPC